MSCCLPEKIRVSKTDWVCSGSMTCYCCPFPGASDESRLSQTPAKMANDDWLCNNIGKSDMMDVNPNFCRKKCIQAMIITKLTFEFPSVCRDGKPHPQNRTVEFCT